MRDVLRKTEIVTIPVAMLISTYSGLILLPSVVAIKIATAIGTSKKIMSVMIVHGKDAPMTQCFL